jgi:hypothetical protein
MIAHAWENRQSHVWENWQSHLWENWHEPACGNMGAEPQRAANLLIRRSSLRAWCLHGCVGGLEAALWRLKELQLRCGLAAGGLA